MKKKSLLLVILFLLVTLGAGKEVILADVVDPTSITPFQGFFYWTWNSDIEEIAESFEETPYEINAVSDWSGYKEFTNTKFMEIHNGVYGLYFDDNKLKSYCCDTVITDSDDSFYTYLNSEYGDPQIIIANAIFGMGSFEDLLIWIDIDNNSFLKYYNDGDYEFLYGSVFDSQINSKTMSKESTGVEDLMDKIINYDESSERYYSVDHRDELIGYWCIVDLNGYAITSVMSRDIKSIEFYNDDTFSLKGIDGDIDGQWSIVHDGTAIELRGNQGTTRVYGFSVDEEQLIMETDSQTEYASFIRDP